MATDERDQDTTSYHIDTGGGTYIEGGLHIYGGGTNSPPPDLDGPVYHAARARYLDALRAHHDYVETHAFTALAPDERVGQPKRLRLLGEGGIFVPLTLDTPLREIDRQDRMSKEDVRVASLWEFDSGPLPEVLRLFPGHLAIVGDAGSGKTTLLQVIASALAAPDPEAAFGARFDVLGSTRPLPILLPLRLFERACARQEEDPQGYRRCAADLLRFVDDWFARWSSVDLPEHFLARHILGGRAWLLLDALDEVPKAEDRQTVRNTILELAGNVGQTRIIVTARVAAYRGVRLDDRFTEVRVRDLDEGQRAQMVRAVYLGLALPDAERRAEDLVERFAGSEALQGLARTPVMVWTAAVIHALRGELPDSRAALYDAYVDILLRQSFKRTQYDAAAVQDLVDGQWPLQERRHYLSYAAFEVHRLLEGQAERRASGSLAVGEDELADRLLARYFRDNLGYGLLEARKRAREFVTLMVERSGLLYESEQGYTIGDHITMQEFLAGCYLGDGYVWEDPEGYRGLLADKVGESWWREVFRLAAGALAERPGFAARTFLQQIAGQGTTPQERLVALALAGRGLLDLASRHRRPNWYEATARFLADRLYTTLFGDSIEAPPAARHEAGLVLGSLYGHPTRGNLHDPRFSGPLGLAHFASIPAGWCWIGGDERSEEDEYPRHRVYLDAYEVARYPTTNATYTRFVEARGYLEGRWWEEAMEDGYWTEEQGFKYGNQPRFWDHPQWNNPAQPVTGVSWYESTAYCRWLTATADDGYTYRLPSEAEWERAARGRANGGGRYPWGDEWSPERCNCKETGLERTSPVGIFAAGTTAEGLHDMAGNVWEWCADWYANGYYAHSREARNPAGPTQGELRVLRGGAYYSDANHCRCGYRFRFIPWFWDDYWGFRCVRSSRT